MPAGRPRKSLDLHLVETGNRPRARDVRREEVTPRSAPIKSIPRRLNADQKAVWRDLARSLAPGVLQTADAVRFEELVVTVTMQRQLLEAFNEAGGQVYVKPRGRRKGGVSPLYEELAKLSVRLRVLASEFGMTPTSRSHVQVPKSTAAGDPLDEFTGKPPGA
jgi:P27 family predicted phage terminase small subunit